MFRSDPDAEFSPEVPLILKHPVFKPHLKVKVVEGEGTFILSDLKHKVIHGRIYENLIPHLCGNPVEKICQDLVDKLTPAEIFYAISKLQKSGDLVEADSLVDHEDAAMWSEQGIDANVASSRLARTALSVRAFGNVSEAFITDILRSSRMNISDNGELAVIVTDSYLRSEISSWSVEARRNKIPWLLAKPVGRSIWLGPFFNTDVGSCWSCLRGRLLANHPIFSYLEGKSGNDGGTVRSLFQSRAHMQLAGGLIANAVNRMIITGKASHLERKIQAFDTLNGMTEIHELIGRPWCEECGDHNSPKDFVAPKFLPQSHVSQDGGYRSITPEETVERYGRHVSPLVGIVPELRRIEFEGENPMPVYVSGANAARKMSNLSDVRDGFRSMASGKGKTAAQARAGALAEALERYSAEFRGNENRISNTFEQMGEAAIHPNECMLFSERQYEHREAWNKGSSGFNRIPNYFDGKAKIEWSPLWSMTNEAVRYLPTAFCYFDVPAGLGGRFCASCSNGNAAGNTLEEAVLQGFLELVERDSVALWWYNRLKRPCLDLASFDEPSLGQMKQFLLKHDREFWVLNLTSDLGIPVFAATSRKIGHASEDIIMGFGAHLDPSIALMRATGELSQMLRVVAPKPGIVSVEKRTEDIRENEVQHWLSTATLSTERYLVPQEITPIKRKDFTPLTSGNLYQDILTCKQLVESKGMEMLVLDQTRADVGLPVVKVIVPGLRHFWVRKAPGRLYDVPVKLGWISKPNNEDDLNPIAFFL